MRSHCSVWPQSLFELDRRCPLILEARHQRAGLGHSFISFAQVVELAASLQLTLRAHFSGSADGAWGAGVNASIASSALFGSHFAHSLPVGATTKHVARDRLSATVAKLRRDCGEARSPPQPVVLKLDKAPQCCQTSALQACNWRRALAASTPVVSGRSRQGSLRIAVHLRRGDIVAQANNPLRGDRFETFYATLHRAIPNQAYLGILRDVLRAVGKQELTALDVVLHCDMPHASPDAIPDVNASEASDFRSALSEAVASSGMPGATIKVRMGPPNVVDAFRSICTADIVLMARSTLSCMSALLCPSPVFLATPYHHATRHLPNVIPLRPIPRAYYELYYHTMSRSNTKGEAAQRVKYSRGVKLHTQYSFSESRLRKLLRAAAT